MPQTSPPDIQSGWAHRAGLFDLAPAEPDVPHLLTAEDRSRHPGIVRPVRDRV